MVLRSDPSFKPYERALFVLGATVLFGGIDYLGYNLTRHDATLRPMYRVFQVITQILISRYLFEKVGLPSTVAFNLIWWTFGADLAYYGFAEILNPAASWDSKGLWERRGDFSNSVLGNHTTWAWWTPIGITRGMKRDAAIAGDTLLAQAFLGAVIGFSFSIVF